MSLNQSHPQNEASIFCHISSNKWPNKLDKSFYTSRKPNFIGSTNTTPSLLKMNKVEDRTKKQESISVKSKSSAVFDSIKYLYFNGYLE